jgi:hypothetical protein
MSPQATTFLANSSKQALSTMAYTLKDSWTGNEFIKGNEKGDKWSFFQQPDPTHGQVHYGKWNELIKIVDGKIKIEVESEVFTQRKSTMEGCLLSI